MLGTSCSDPKNMFVVQEFNLSLDIYLNAIRIRLGHESLDVTLGYLKDKDAESEEAQGTCEQQQPSAVRISS